MHKYSILKKVQIIIGTYSIPGNYKVKNIQSAPDTFPEDMQ